MRSCLPIRQQLTRICRASSARQCGNGWLFEAPNGHVRMRCSKCSTESCFACRCEWHTGLTCEQHAATTRDASEQLIATISRPCPKCKVAIEKNGGCDHMARAASRLFTRRVPHRAPLLKRHRRDSRARPADVSGV